MSILVKSRSRKRTTCRKLVNRIRALHESHGQGIMIVGMSTFNNASVNAVAVSSSSQATVVEVAVRSEVLEVSGSDQGALHAEPPKLLET